MEVEVEVVVIANGDGEASALLLTLFGHAVNVIDEPNARVAEIGRAVEADHAVEHAAEIFVRRKEMRIAIDELLDHGVKIAFGRIAMIWI